ncbi:hypothetical protein H310_12426 [Aphanomyces invadans]|uniref:Uncharacterized protein n=1 Tax=Aphanomyces invadans TaxID=157072 RepID=A0A024THW7_9STRA|nr:hypothetical protein H310_12426 [Aphanomyces invadans]ETV93658.1 hypothetical protein H310_12426 [Aphanomyces invadans]|eukprot:XP_008877699.1 hypothetical protein H310_12426 [Aphanomyces invadans]
MPRNNVSASLCRSSMAWCPLRVVCRFSSNAEASWVRRGDGIEVDANRTHVAIPSQHFFHRSTSRRVRLTPRHKLTCTSRVLGCKNTWTICRCGGSSWWGACREMSCKLDRLQLRPRTRPRRYPRYAVP